MLKAAFCFFIFLLISTSGVFAISFPRNHALLSSSEIADSNALYFTFNNANFLWNNEFFNDVVEGYTLIGYFAKPQLKYYLSPNIAIEAGANFQKYSGIDTFSSILPTYALTYKKNNHKLIMGTLQGSIHHKVSEPLLHTEKYYTSQLENGVQYLLNTNRIWLDVWLDWQTFIFANDNKQEQLVFGSNAIASVVNTNAIELNAIATVFIGHRGGQIDITGKNIQTLMNYGLGFDFGTKINSKHLNKISLESQLVGFNDNSPTVESLYKEGYGVLNNLRFSKNESYLQLGYWFAYKYSSMLGHPIYQCESRVDNTLNKENRNLVTASVFYSKTIYPGVYLGLMADVLYDTESSILDHSMGLTLILNQEFFITRFKNKK